MQINSKTGLRPVCNDKLSKTNEIEARNPPPLFPDYSVEEGSCLLCEPFLADLCHITAKTKAIRMLPDSMNGYISDEIRSHSPVKFIMPWKIKRRQNTSPGVTVYISNQKSMANDHRQPPEELRMKAGVCVIARKTDKRRVPDRPHNTIDRRRRHRSQVFQQGIQIIATKPDFLNGGKNKGEQDEKQFKAEGSDHRLQLMSRGASVTPSKTAVPAIARSNSNQNKRINSNHV